MIRTVLLTAAMTVALPLPAYADTYIAHIDYDKEVMAALDLDFIRDVGGYKRAWQSATFYDGGFKQRIQVQNLVQFDCSQERSQNLSSIIRSLDGSVLYKDDAPANWRFAAPATPVYMNLQVACGEKVPETNRLFPDSVSDAIRRFWKIVDNNKSSRP